MNKSCDTRTIPSLVAQQHTATHCNTLHTLQHTANVTHKNESHDTCTTFGVRTRGSVSEHCNSPQHTATHCNTYFLCRAQTCSGAATSTATHSNTLQHTATHCNTLQHSASHHYTLQLTGTHCNTLKHTAKHCNTSIETHCKILQHM